MLQPIIEQLKSSFSSADHPLLVILGPTASGKTKLSLVLGQALDCEIVSADSRQIYRGLEIGADAILTQEQAGIPHHLLTFLDPNDAYSLADYHRDAKRLISDIYKRAKIPMLVGGTGLYISSIVEGYQMQAAKPDFGLRYQLQKEYEQYGAEYLHKKLADMDPQAAAQIHPNNLRYVIRAIEINLQSGGNKQSDKKGAGYNYIQIGLDWPREVLYERVNLRVDKQIKRGLIDEVKSLLPVIKPDSPAYSSLGFKEIAEYLKGNISLEEAIELVKKNTRNYAKRQLTWFRRNKNILWLDGAAVEKELATYQL